MVPLLHGEWAEVQTLAIGRIMQRGGEPHARELSYFSRLVDGAYEVYTVKPDGSSPKRLTFSHGNDAHMAWSPDGEHIIFASSRMGFKDEATYTDAPQP